MLNNSDIDAYNSSLPDYLLPGKLAGKLAALYHPISTDQ